MLKFYTILISLLVIYNSGLIAQPYIFNEEDDNHYENGRLITNYSGNYIVRINLNNGHKDTVDGVGRVSVSWDNTQNWLLYTGWYSEIKNINNQKIDFQLSFDPYPEMAIYVKQKNKMFMLDGSDLVVLNTKTGKEKTRFKFNYHYDVHFADVESPDRIFLSSDENKLYIPFYDTIFNPVRDDRIKVAEISTSSNKIVRTWKLQKLGRPGSNFYDLVCGRNGKGIIISDFEYYSIYDFEHDSGSPFIYNDHNPSPYFTHDGKYLILNEIKDSSKTSYNTGKFLIYNATEKKLVKILNLPHDSWVLSKRYPKDENIHDYRLVYTFDNFPENLYYYYQKTERAITLNIDSLVNTPSGPTDFPKVIMYNLGTTYFTADFINNKIKYELGTGFTLIKPATPAGDNLLYNEYDENNNLLGVFSFEKGYTKGAYTKDKNKKILHFSRIDIEP